MESQQKSKRTHKTIEEKIKIVKYAEQNSLHKSAEKYDVDRKKYLRMEKPVSGFNRSVKQINKNDHAFRQKNLKLMI